MNRKLFVVSILVTMALMLYGCTTPAYQVSDVAETESKAPGIATPEITPSPEQTPHASTRLDFVDIKELEKYLKDIKTDKSMDIYGDISSEKYFKLEKELPGPMLTRITINESLMTFLYTFDDKRDDYSQNCVKLIWYRTFDNGTDFIRNIWSEGLTYEEIEYKGTLYLYRKAVAPAGENGEDIEVCQYAHWAQGNDCFSCVFPLRYSKEEFLDYCRAVSKKID